MMTGRKKAVADIVEEMTQKLLVDAGIKKGCAFLTWVAGGVIYHF
jgi:hypothetical protein